MVKFNNVEEIKEFAKEYLTSKNIDFMRKHEKDKCNFKVIGQYGLFYIEVGKSSFDKILTGAELPAQSEGHPTPSYSGDKSNRFVCDEYGNIILDIEPVESYCFINNYADQIFLDEQNMLVPILARKGSWPKSNNDIQHIRIQNGKAEVINTFDGQLGIPQGNPTLFQNKLTNINNQLYDFSKGTKIDCQFGQIISDRGHRQSHMLRDLIELAGCWGIPQNRQREELAIEIFEKMKSDNLFVGTNSIRVEKDNIVWGYTTLVFINSSGEITSDLLYNDNNNIVSVPVDNQSYSGVINELTEKANQEVDRRIAEKNDKKEILPRALKKMFPKTTQN